MTSYSSTSFKPAHKWIVTLGFIAVALALIPVSGIFTTFILVPFLAVASVIDLLTSRSRQSRIAFTWLLMGLAIIVAIASSATVSV